MTEPERLAVANLLFALVNLEKARAEPIYFQLDEIEKVQKIATARLAAAEKSVIEAISILKDIVRL